ncbi:MAG: penicillin-binding protein 2 [Chitinivibrionia bacterium]|nr:penicillin-binding protein 2 [Chitinivibrionia bacterium]
MGKRSSKDEQNGRTLQKQLLYFALGCLFILVVRLFALQIVQYDYYRQYAENNQLQRERIIAPRGLIEDSRGEILVDNVPRFEITIPWEREWKKRNAGLPFPVITNANKVVISAVRENEDLFPKLRVVTKGRRRYRFDNLGAHILGFVGQVTDEELETASKRGYQPGDMIGKMGLEGAYDEQLRGVDGQRVVEVNAAGSVMGEVSKLLTPPVPGKTIRLTIRADLQLLLERLLLEWHAGSAVAMNVHTGAILAAASLPQFDPNRFSTGIPQDEWDEMFSSERKPLFNRITQASYPPGSTMKIVTSAAALENRVVARDRVLTCCTGGHRFGNRVFRCWKPEGHGCMNMYNAIVQSCDSYFYKIGESIDIDELASMARSFGLGRKTGIDVAGETAGLIPDRAYYNRRYGKRGWTQGYVLNNVIGQGEVLTSVLQMCRVAAAVANGGRLVRPHLVESISGEPVAVQAPEPVRGLTLQTLAFLRSALAGVVEEGQGTAHGSRTEKIRFAGKTGTAQNPHGNDHAWFVCYAPVELPEIAMAIIVENAGHGSSVAAPIARDFFLAYFIPDSVETVAQSVDREAEPQREEGVVR